VLGVHVLLVAAVPHRGELRGIADYYRRELARLGVDVRTGSSATVDGVLAERPHAVVVALGSRPAAPDVPLDGITLVTADDVLRGARPGGSVVVFDDDGGFRGPGAALLLARAGARVEIVTPALHVGIRLDPSNLPPFYRHLFAAGIAMTPSHALVAASAGSVRLRNVYVGDEVERRGIDALVASLLRRVPEDGLHHALRGRVEVHLVGDAAAARPTDKVILEASVLGRRL
jgi:2,4-dienoyl-CoA reductase (NADPH2)